MDDILGERVGFDERFDGGYELIEDKQVVFAGC